MGTKTETKPGRWRVIYRPADAAWVAYPVPFGLGSDRAHAFPSWEAAYNHALYYADRDTEQGTLTWQKYLHRSSWGWPSHPHKWEVTSR